MIKKVNKLKFRNVIGLHLGGFTLRSDLGVQGQKNWKHDFKKISPKFHQSRNSKIEADS